MTRLAKRESTRRNSAKICVEFLGLDRTLPAGWFFEPLDLADASQVLERLRPHGYTGGISILRERVRRLRPLPTPKAYLTVAYQPGACVQVDWADFGFALPGVPRRVSAFVALMAYSRKLYAEFVLSQATGSFLRCMDRALEFFVGVMSADVFDNMKTVVLEHHTRAFLEHRRRCRGPDAPTRLARIPPDTTQGRARGALRRSWLRRSTG